MDKNLLKKQVVFTLSDLSTIMNISVRTVQRHLKQWDIIRSYDNNGKYFALRESSQYNKYFIWNYKGIHFSKYGTLKNTLVGVIKNSETGLSAKEIQQIIGLDTRSFLFHYKDSEEIRREKIQGYYVYFSSEISEYNYQLTGRKKQLLSNKILISPLKNTVAIAVLVELIKNPDFTEEKLLEHLRKQKIKSCAKLKSQEITEFLIFHGIKKKANLIGKKK